MTSSAALSRIAYANAGNTIELARQADMIIGAVLIPGAAAPKLISRAQLSELKPGAALVDVAIDQGGCFETSRATTHQDPIYEVDGIMHYCVANMPGAVARTSTLALGNATLPFMLALADKGWKKACADDKHLLAGSEHPCGQADLCRCWCRAWPAGDPGSGSVEDLGRFRPDLKDPRDDCRGSLFWWRAVLTCAARRGFRLTSLLPSDPWVPPEPLLLPSSCC